MKKTSRFFAAAFIAGLTAPAASLALSLPSTPMTLPTRIAVQRVELRTLPIAPARLPSFSRIDSAPVRLPVLPALVPGERVQLPGQPAMTVHMVFALADAPADPKVGEKLDKTYDRGQKGTANEPRRDERPVTVPTSDLLEEIGVSPNY